MASFGLDHSPHCTRCRLRTAARGFRRCDGRCGTIRGMATRVVAADPTAVLEDVELERATFAPRWIVIVWNDPINLMTYVTFVFRKLFGYSHAHAQELMLKVHYEGRAVVAGGTQERCEHDVTRLHAHGLWATMQEE
jgi:ATP-dependent Clp protease adaptor protein ClpS